MNQLEIILPVRNPTGVLRQTIQSLTAQANHSFSVLISDNSSSKGIEFIDESVEHLQQTGIAVRCVSAPFEMARIVHWNWSHAQSQAEWIKPLLPGAQLKATYVERLLQRASERPHAALLRCDADVRTEWGAEVLRAPSAPTSLTPAEFLDYFPARVDWIGNLLNVAFRRVAWRALGGYPVHLPACAPVSLNALLSLHYGMENLPESLVNGELLEKFPSDKISVCRVNLWLELSLVMCQMRNYCLTTRLAWPKGGVIRGIWRGQSLRPEPV
jgi:hypothetical protein